MTIHNYRKTRTYTSWVEMRQRCLNPNNVSYHNYGGRGIAICPEWDSFVNFLADMGDRPDGCSLDRIRVNEGYSKANCKWSTAKEQIRNTRANVYLTFEGRTQCLAAWAEEYNIPDGTLAKRLRDGWSMEISLTKPLNEPQLGVAHNQKPVEYNGRSQTIKAWAAEYGIKYATLHKRVTKYNMTLEEALTRPIKKYNANI